MKHLKKALCLTMLLSILISVMGVTAAADSMSALPSSSKILLNGSSVSLQAYNIEGHNYFKLRDLALILSGTDKQFDVSFDREANAINIFTGSPYTPVGGEGIVNGSASTQTAYATQSTVYIDGNDASFTAYNIGGNNYFMLRAIAAKIDFGLSWNSSASSISIDTSSSYVSDGSEAKAIIGNWGQIVEEEAGSYALGFSFDASGNYYRYCRLFGEYLDENGVYSTGKLNPGASAAGNLIGRYTISGSDANKTLTGSGGSISYVKKDSSGGILGTWTYAGDLGYSYVTLDLVFGQDNLVYADSWVKEGTYTVSGDTIKILLNNGDWDIWTFNITTEGGKPVFNHGGMAYQYQY